MDNLDCLPATAPPRRFFLPSSCLQPLQQPISHTHIHTHTHAHTHPGFILGRIGCRVVDGCWYIAMLLLQQRWCDGVRGSELKPSEEVRDDARCSGHKTPATPALNAAERDTLAGVPTFSPGCCAAGWDTPTPRRVKTFSAIAPFVSYSFAPSASSRYCSRFSTGRTTSRGKCCFCPATIDTTQAIRAHACRPCYSDLSTL